MSATTINVTIFFDSDSDPRNPGWVARGPNPTDGVDMDVDLGTNDPDVDDDDFLISLASSFWPEGTEFTVEYPKMYTYADVQAAADLDRLLEMLNSRLVPARLWPDLPWFADGVGAPDYVYSWDDERQIVSSDTDTNKFMIEDRDDE